MTEEEIIQFIGIKELDEAEQVAVNKLATEYYQKVKMMLDNLTSLSLHVKTIDKGGKKQYEIMIKAIAPTQLIESNNSHDQDKWDLSRCLHKAFGKLLSEIEHKLKTSVQHD